MQPCIFAVYGLFSSENCAWQFCGDFFIRRDKKFSKKNNCEVESVYICKLLLINLMYIYFLGNRYASAVYCVLQQVVYVSILNPSIENR